MTESDLDNLRPPFERRCQWHGGCDEVATCCVYQYEIDREFNEPRDLLWHAVLCAVHGHERLLELESA